MSTAVVVGGGIGGLTSAIALRRTGWLVTVLEQAESFGEIGAGIVLMSNGLRCLDALGLGDAVRGSGRPDVPTGVRTASGRWLSRIDGTALEQKLGTAAIVLHRAALHTILRDALPSDSLIPGATPTSISGAEVRYTRGDSTAVARADLVVGADGVDSWVRSRCWPDVPAPIYSGSTAWRAITDSRPGVEMSMSMTWGLGTEFGVMPLADGRIYWYAAANSPEGRRAPDELSEVRRLCGSWHAPIPELLAATSPEAVLRHDIYRLTDLPSYTRGSVALLGDAAHAMTPNLGQGGGQAIEDAFVLAAAIGSEPDVNAALARYDRERRTRTQAMSRAATSQLRFGQQLSNPLAVALRNTAIALTPDRVALRAATRYATWSPPPLSTPHT